MIDFPNALYDPVKGHELYNRHLRTMIRAEQLGFDGLAVNEHHSMVYSMTPTVSLMAARLGAVTHRRRSRSPARRSTCSTRTASRRSTRCST